MIPWKDENPVETFPISTLLIIALNIVAFIFQINLLTHGSDITNILGLRPYYLLKHPDGIQIATIFTSMFLHGGILHILGNMWFLWIFGNNIEDALGHFQYILFYLLCGLGAALVQIFADPSSHIPMIGASGAISGILGAYLLLFPRARIVTIIPIFIFIQFVRLPAILFLGLWFLIQFFGATVQSMGGGGEVAFFAHVGGFLTGLLFIKILPKRRGF